MRYIALNRLRPTQEWRERAERAKAEVASSSVNDRTDVINKFSYLWGELKKTLGELSEKKCWYCESFEKRSDVDVDHYRPKNSVKECPAHPGYWWLAFEHDNYRYSCNFCNRPRCGTGKCDHFPLLDETKRISEPGIDLDLEDPALLDPTNPADPTLLWFDEKGTTQPRYDENKNRTCFNRAKCSIDVYGLNHVDLCEARLAISNQIKDYVKNGTKYFSAYCDHQNNVSAKIAFESCIKELVSFISNKAEFSAAARATLLGFREYDWVNSLLQIN